MFTLHLGSSYVTRRGLDIALVLVLIPSLQMPQQERDNHPLPFREDFSRGEGKRHITYINNNNRIKLLCFMKSNQAEPRVTFELRGELQHEQNDLLEALLDPYQDLLAHLINIYNLGSLARSRIAVRMALAHATKISMI